MNRNPRKIVSVSVSGIDFGESLHFLPSTTTLIQLKDSISEIGQPPSLWHFRLCFFALDSLLGFLSGANSGWRECRAINSLLAVKTTYIQPLFTARVFSQPRCFLYPLRHLELSRSSPYLLSHSRKHSHEF